MAKKKYRRYSPEFKRHALKRASEDGVTDKEVCEDLGISPRQLGRWRDQYRLLGDEAFPGQGKRRDEEVAELKRKLAKAEQERDFLKDAAVVLADPEWRDEAPGDTLDDIIIPKNLTICATSFEEFIYRFWLENTIWFALVESRELTETQESYRRAAAATR